MEWQEPMLKKKIAAIQKTHDKYLRDIEDTESHINMYRAVILCQQDRSAGLRRNVERKKGEADRLRQQAGQDCVSGIDHRVGFAPEFRFRFPSGNLLEFFSISIMEKVPEDPEFRSVFRIFPERNSGMCSGKFPEQRSGNREIFRKQCHRHVHRHPHCTSVLR